MRVINKASNKVEISKPLPTNRRKRRGTHKASTVRSIQGRGSGKYVLNYAKVFLPMFLTLSTKRTRSVFVDPCSIVSWLLRCSFLVRTSLPGAYKIAPYHAVPVIRHLECQNND